MSGAQIQNSDITPGSTVVGPANLPDPGHDVDIPVLDSDGKAIANPDGTPKVRTVKSRIGELTQKRHEAERKAAYWQGIAEGKSPAVKDTAVSPAPAAAPVKPKKEDFKDYDDFAEALADWKIETRGKDLVKESETRLTNQRQAEIQKQTWETRQVKFAETKPDYYEVVSNSEVPIAPHVGVEILASIHGPALAYHLTQNPDVAMKLNQMDSRSAVREIARLETILNLPTMKDDPDAGSDGEKTPKTLPVPAGKLVSGAPVPVSSVRSGGAAAPVELSKASMDDYIATRKKQGAAWAR